MKRRDFVTLASRLALGLASKELKSDSPIRRAVVIGVGKAGDLPKLKGASLGAQKVANWLRGEGFEVVEKLDTAGPVKLDDLYAAVSGIVDRGADQLVVYFAGHGFNRAFSEFWLLSDAPRNPNQAVSVIESCQLARQSGIPNVVFISDACRSRADSLGAERVNGGYIFPNPVTAPAKLSAVDVFLATLAGDPSYEVPVAKSSSEYQGIYTEAFLSAFENPDDSMVLRLQDLRVVPNRRMAEYLTREVAKRAGAISIGIRQVPDAQVVSSEDTYIGRVRGDGSPHTNVEAHAPTVQDLAAISLAKAGIRGSPGLTLGHDSSLSYSGYTKLTEAIKHPADFPALQKIGGIAIAGTQLKLAEAGPSVHVEFIPPKDFAGDAFQLVRVNFGSEPAASVALQFNDGGGTVVAALRGFVANISVNKGQVVNVSYVPAIGSPNFAEFSSERARLDALHSAVATAARFGVFRIEGEGAEGRNSSARMLADQIRVLKGVDPTLGIYAAYAYSQAGLRDQVRSVSGIMKGNLDVDLFDVAMLSGNLARRSFAEIPRLFPFCPMLWQGWNLLRVLDVRLDDRVVDASKYLRPSLWTTFEAKGMLTLIKALRGGWLRFGSSGGRSGGGSEATHTPRDRPL